jgi:hypothetical protein
MFNWIAKKVTAGLVSEFKRSRQELENELSEQALKVIANKMIDDIIESLKSIDNNGASLAEVERMFQDNRAHGSRFEHNYNCVLWGVFRSWSRAATPEYDQYLVETFQFLFTHGDVAKCTMLKTQVARSQAYLK